MAKKALLLIDIQNDFLPGGALPVPNGDKILPHIDALLQQDFDLIVATKDWHPHNHGSFADHYPEKQVGEVIDLEGVEQILWPAHCVQETEGAEFGPGWDVEKVEAIFFKGIDPHIDSYSGFFDNGHKRATGLGDFLKERGIDEVYVAGLATDYCVKYTVLDACELSFKTFVIVDACKGIDLNDGDVENALKEMQNAGAHLIR